ncbi:MAG: tetratricopeptide repeat protein [Candidatus Alcyoniella australis]|nr:tetratricopeptide repeat protein [Candidatus Alcyoniella australis]
MRASTLIIGVLLGALCACALASHAVAAEQDSIDETAQIHFAAATAAYLRGDYQLAADRFALAHHSSPQLTIALYWEGVCANALGDYNRAEDRLQRFLDTQGEPADRAHFELAVASIGLQRWQRALSQLDRAALADQPRPEIAYYRGLCLVRLERTDQARVWLQRALSNTPQWRDRILALLAACDLIDGDRSAATRNINEALSATHDQGLRDELSLTIEAIERSADRLRWWDLWLRLGGGYDSNAALISDEFEDASPESYIAEAALQALLLPLHRPALKQWIGYRFDGRMHLGYDKDQQPDASEFDMLRHRGLLGIQGRIGLGRSAALQPALGYTFSHVTLGGEDYLLEHRADPSLTIIESRLLATRLAYALLYDDYYQIDDLDGLSHRAELTQFISFWDNGGLISIGGGGEIRQTGAELYDRTAWWVAAGLDAPLFVGIRIDVNYSYRQDDYSDHPLERYETGNRMGVGLRRKFVQRLTLEVRAQVTDVTADPEIYSYSRLVGGAWLKWEF